MDRGKVISIIGALALASCEKSGAREPVKPDPIVNGVGTLIVESNPRGASVKLDGKAVPIKTPIKVTAVAGEHTVEVAAEGHPPETRTITVKRDGEAREKFNFVPPEPATEMTAVALWHAYQANALTYEGKRLRVTGTLQSVDRGGLGTIFIHIAASENLGDVRTSVTCSVPRDASIEKLSTLKPGDQVVVEGTGAQAVLGAPSMNDCNLVAP